MQPNSFDGFGDVHRQIADRIDRVLTRAANRLGWCGKNGRVGGLSSRIADLFWVECNCCLFYRGVFVGVFGLATALVMLYIAAYVMTWGMVFAFVLGAVAAHGGSKLLEPIKGFMPSRTVSDIIQDHPS